jgi:hypothetical protein
MLWLPACVRARHCIVVLFPEIILVLILNLSRLPLFYILLILRGSRNIWQILLFFKLDIL